MKIWWILGVWFFACPAQAQSLKYSTQNAHSHNDYEQRWPFWLAYNHEFGSIEADVFLKNEDLRVAHRAQDIQKENTLRQLYLNPLRKCLQQHQGTVYADPQKKLMLLIDCKTEAKATLAVLLDQLREYPDLTTNATIRFVITGNQPAKDSLYIYPPFIWFDGDPTYPYSSRNLNRLALFSTHFKNQSHWRGIGTLPAQDSLNLIEMVEKAHGLGKTIRFWGSPDVANAWSAFSHLNIDWLNTDHIESLALFLNQARPSTSGNLDN